MLPTESTPRSKYVYRPTYPQASHINISTLLNTASRASLLVLPVRTVRSGRGQIQQTWLQHKTHLIATTIRTNPAEEQDNDTSIFTDWLHWDRALPIAAGSSSDERTPLKLTPAGTSSYGTFTPSPPPTRKSRITWHTPPSHSRNTSASQKVKSRSASPCPLGQRAFDSASTLLGSHCGSSRRGLQRAHAYLSPAPSSSSSSSCSRDSTLVDCRGPMPQSCNTKVVPSCELRETSRMRMGLRAMELEHRNQRGGGFREEFMDAWVTEQQEIVWRESEEGRRVERFVID